MEETFYSYPQCDFLANEGWDRHWLRVGCHVLLEKEGKILLLKRKGTGYRDGWWSLPGGHLEPKEGFLRCAARESKEEIGIKALEINLKAVHLMHKFEEGDEALMVVMKVKKWTGIPVNKEPKLASEIAWFPKNKLPKKTIPYISYAIKNIQNDVFYSQYGWK